MTFSAALTTDTDAALRSHLLRADRQEDLAFALYRPSTGAARRTAIIGAPILPERGDRNVHGNASFTADYFLRAAQEAAAEGAGLAFLHSHPGGRGHQGMSDDDVQAEHGHAAQALAITDMPLVGLTLAGDGAWSAREWRRRSGGSYERRDAEAVRVVGAELRVTYEDRQRPVPTFREELARTISAWGPDVQAALARLSIAVVGAGSVGTIIAEALARTGIQHIVLIDFDTVKTVNLDRLLHATRRDAALHRSKVSSLRRALLRNATAREPQIEALEWSVVEEQGFHAALDADVIFSCVDRPWPRAALNLVAYGHLIPVVDGGIQAATAGGRRLVGADWKAHVAAPGRQCLECLGQYDPGLVAAEREGLLDDPSYISGLPLDHPFRANQNVFAFSLGAASLEILQLLSMVVAPSGVGDIGAQNYHFVTGALDIDTHACQPTCLYARGLLGRGDHADVPVTGRHHAAERERAERATASRRVPVRLGRYLDDAVARWR